MAGTSWRGGNLARLAVAGAGAAWLFGVVGLLWRFTADDAFIVARVADHAVRLGDPSFNVGDRINVLTSPLEGVFLSLLDVLTSSPLPAYKLLAAIIVATTLVGASLRRYSSPPVAFVFVALTAGSPFVALWTSGGLETSLLLGAVTLITLSLPGALAGDRRAAALVCVASALAFSTRYDAALFVAFPVGALVWERRDVRWALPLTTGLSLPAIVGPWLYFGHVWPTPAYLKVPQAGSLLFVGRSLLYEVSFLLLSGVALVACLSSPSGGRQPRGEAAIALGLGATLAYGLLVAATHMMFGYRLLVPYLPSLAIVVLDRRTVHWPWRTGCALLAGQAALAAYVATRSVNPTVLNLLDVELRGEGNRLSPTLHPGESHTFEYPREGARAYGDFIDVMRAVAADGKKHWEAQAASADRPPRVLTFAAGALPHVWRDAYVLDALSSFRTHCAPPLELSADYVVTLSSVDERERWGNAPPGFSLLLRRELVFDGGPASVDVLFQRDPAPSRLPNRLAEPCTGAD